MEAPQARSSDLHSSACRDAAFEKPVDLEHLRRYTLGDKALEDEVLALFLAQLPVTIASLKTAASPRDWKIAAHALKGSSRAVGAWRIASLAQEAEALAGDKDEAAACSAAIAKLEAAASEASIFVQSCAERS